MECGVAIGLNPLGGNQLNVRELLRRLHPEPSAVSDDGSDAGGMEDAAAGSSAPEREVPEPTASRRLRDDEYDYDDDFIDDAELVEVPDEPEAADDEQPYDESADEDFKPEDEDDAGDDAVKAKPKPPPLVHHGFGRFFVNKGGVATKAQVAPLPNPPDSIGNVAVKIPGLRDPTPPSAPEAKDVALAAKPAEGIVKPTAAASGAEIGKKPASSSASGTPSGVAGTSAPPAKKPKVDAGPSAKSGKGIPAAVITEIGKLEQLCRDEFGDKKPKMGDAKVQDQLSVIFREAMKSGVGRLFSDIAKDRRVVALNDEVWTRLSRFIRTKRATIETLGHALHWRTKEIEATSRVAATEGKVDAVLQKQREAWPVHSAGEQQEKTERPVMWDRELDERLFDWYRARSDLQSAKNQLGARVRSVKKSMPGWVNLLKNRAFAGFTVGEQEVIDSFRRIEEERAVLERQKRDAERAERKRKKEEQAASSAAKKAATANAKGAPTPVPVPAAAGAAPDGAIADVPTVITVVPKPKNVVKNGGAVKNGGTVKHTVSAKNGGPGKSLTGVKTGGISKNGSAAKNGGMGKVAGMVKTGGSGKTTPSKAPMGKTPVGKSPVGAGKSTTLKSPAGKVPPAGKSPVGKAATGKGAIGKSPSGKSPSGKPGVVKGTGSGKTGPSKGAGAKAAVTRVTGGKGSGSKGGSVKAVSGTSGSKTTPVKGGTSKQAKTGGGSGQGGALAGPQKQMKLTGLMKKSGTGKSEGSEGTGAKQTGTKTGAVEEAEAGQAAKGGAEDGKTGAGSSKSFEVIELD